MNNESNPNYKSTDAEVLTGRDADFLWALCQKAPGVAYAGNPQQYVDAVIYNHLEDRLNKVLPDSLNRSLEERIKGLTERANREAELAVKLRNLCEELKPGSSSHL